jgi:NAD(P)-dependent dehydrogenase (short-subunit alcohol dehydrogenase family)
MGSLDGKVAVITGGATGIGLAASRMLAGEGATVVIASRNAARGESVAAAIRDGGGRATSVPTDVTDDGQVAELAKHAAEERGVIDIWFNNAGMEAESGPLEAVGDEGMRDLLNTNVKGVYSGMRYAAAQMRENGLIINNASFVGWEVPVPVAIAYGGTKAAVIAMTRAAALSLADERIDVVAIAPWVIDTPMIDRITGHQGPQARAGLAALYNPSGKLVPAEHTGEVVTALANRTSSFRSGDVLLVDHGPTVTTMV